MSLVLQWIGQWLSLYGNFIAVEKVENKIDFFVRIQSLKGERKWVYFTRCSMLGTIKINSVITSAHVNFRFFFWSIIHRRLKHVLQSQTFNVSESSVSLKSGFSLKKNLTPDMSCRNLTLKNIKGFILIVPVWFETEKSSIHSQYIELFHVKRDSGLNALPTKGLLKASCIQSFVPLCSQQPFIIVAVDAAPRRAVLYTSLLH